MGALLEARTSFRSATAPRSVRRTHLSAAMRRTLLMAGPIILAAPMRRPLLRSAMRRPLHIVRSLIRTFSVSRARRTTRTALVTRAEVARTVRRAIVAGASAFEVAATGRWGTVGTMAAGTVILRTRTAGTFVVRSFFARTVETNRSILNLRGGSGAEKRQGDACRRPGRCLTEERGSHEFVFLS